MKKASLILTFVLSVLVPFAQDNVKMTLSVESISAPQGADYGNYPQQIFTMVSGAFVASNRFMVMPTDNWNIPQDAAGDPYVDVAKSYGVTYLITGTINTLSTSNYTTVGQNGVVNPAFAGHLSVSLKVINTENGTIFNSKTFNMNPFLRMVTPEAAINLALNNFAGAVKKWIGETFPLTIELVKILEQNDKKGAVKILIKAGSDSGVVASNKRKDKTQFKIVEYTTETVDGAAMNRTVQVGTAEVALVEDANFTECKVTNGGVDVAKKLGDGKKLFLVSLN